MKLLYLVCFLGISHYSLSQEIGFDIGINKVGYTPFYRTFSENYQPSFKANIVWRIMGHSKNRHQIYAGSWVQWNLQQVVGHQLNMGPLFKYRMRFAGSLFAELQTGYGFQLLFPARKLYEQTQNGDWELANQTVTNHVVPFQIGFGKHFGRHAIHINYEYQLVIGLNPSVTTLPVEIWSIGYQYQINNLK
jgi:hypothetical protein